MDARPFVAVPLLCLIAAGSAPVAAQESELQELCAALQPRLAATGRKNIAVVDFADTGGRVTELARFVSERLSVGLVPPGGEYQLVDRNHLRERFAELKLQDTGLINADTALALGRMVGADAILTGTLTLLDDRVSLTAKLLDTETSVVLAGAAGTLPRSTALEDLLAAFSTGFANTPVTLASVARPATVAGEPTALAPAPRPRTVTSAQGVVVRLVECRPGSGDLVCELTIESVGRRRHVTLHEGTAHDEGANTWRVREVELSGLVGDLSWQKLAVPLAADLKTRLLLHLECPLAADARAARALAELVITAQVEVGGPRFEFVYREVAIKQPPT